MTTRKQYTKDDLQVGTIATFTEDNGTISHTHVVQFGRSLTEAECLLFRAVLSGFYYTVRFSRQFGGELVAEPLVEFVDPQTARYTLRQTSMNGSWKDLLFAILANFSVEVVPILQHDESRAFAPEHVAAVAD